MSAVSWAWADSEEWFVRPVRRHWWKQSSPLQQLSAAGRFLVRGRSSCPFPHSMLGPHLAWFLPLSEIITCVRPLVSVHPTCSESLLLLFYIAPEPWWQGWESWWKHPTSDVPTSVTLCIVLLGISVLAPISCRMMTEEGMDLQVQENVIRSHLVPSAVGGSQVFAGPACYNKAAVHTHSWAGVAAVGCGVLWVCAES